MKIMKSLSPALTGILAILITYATLFVMLATAISPERYDLKVGEVSPITITATKDVVDSVTTNRLRDAAVRGVQPSYISDSSVQPLVLSELQACFDGLIRYKDNSIVMEGEPEPEVPELSDEALIALNQMDLERLIALKEQAYTQVRITLTGKLPQGQENKAIENIHQALLSGGFDEEEVAIALELIAGTLRPNMLLDEATNQANREKAAAEVEPVQYKKGQNIVRSGDVLSANHIEVLNDLGMLKDHQVDLTLFLGLGILLALLLLVLLGYTRSFPDALGNSLRMLYLLCTIILLTMGLSMLFSMMDIYLMPVALGAMLTALLIDPGLAILVNMILSVLTGLLASVNSGGLTTTMFSVTLISLMSGSLCVFILKRHGNRLRILLAGVCVAVVSAAGTTAVGLLSIASTSGIWPLSLWSVGSGILSAVLCIGLQPLLEWLFNVVTPSKLMELSNPNQPLLRRLLLEAPGTYHHSILVANLAEAATNAVGSDGLLARVGAYYHDIGKLKRPLYFKENQVKDNPHDRTDPRVSTAILTAHTADGADMGQKARLPQAVIDIIHQHHGDTPVLFFYDKAMKQGGEVDLEDYRYAGPKPKSKEAAIVMLADTVEAAARAIPESTPEAISQLIGNLIHSKMEDGQLDECPLTLADLNLIREAFEQVLIGVYHERVEYPKVELPERRREPKVEPPKEEEEEESTAPTPNEEEPPGKEEETP
ncbi:MAG: HD family phosphohydrolase [Candidatus Excrementavichristensenella sp.]|jgi:putative nucleotidyltransferase with HDIG domain